MSSIRHDGYTIRDLSFQFSLMILGIKKFVETESIWSKKRSLYKAYFREFEHQLRPALLNLAINFRSMDDEIRRDADNLRVLKEKFTHYSMAFSVPNGLELNLRQVTNKIIHTRKSYWYGENTPHIEQVKKLLLTESEHDLMVLEGHFQGKSWIVGIDLIILSEQFYEFAEVACEYCGV